MMEITTRQRERLEDCVRLGILRGLRELNITSREGFARANEKNDKKA